jgi:hypothetical protein
MAISVFLLIFKYSQPSENNEKNNHRDNCCYDYILLLAKSCLDDASCT